MRPLESLAPSTFEAEILNEGPSDCLVYLIPTVTFALILRLVLFSKLILMNFMQLSECSKFI